MSESEWAEVKGSSLVFANDMRHAYAEKWRRYVATLPEEDRKKQRLVLLGGKLDLSLDELADAIEHDEKVAAAVAAFFSR